MSVRHAILGLLVDGPLHGYEIRSLYEKELVPSSRLNIGQVYTTLERLVRDGLVKPARVAQADRADKKLYELTAGGRRIVEDWLRTPTTPDPDLRNEAFLKLMLARRLKGIDALDVLRVERRAGFERLHELTQARAGAARAGSELEAALLLDLGVLRLEAFMKWLERCEETIRQEGRR
jgi:DNA-binding PadR family transcriptional regulator